MSINLAFVNGNSIPEKRSGHIAVFHKGLLVVFGGYGDNGNRADSADDFMTSKSIWCYCVEASQWTRHNAKGELPEKSTGSCAAIVGDNLYYFGGYVQAKGHTDRLSILDLSKFIWKDITEQVSGVRPSARDKFGCWKKSRKIIYFGGFGQPPMNMNDIRGDFCFEEMPSVGMGFGWNNHLFVLDCDQLNWSQPVCFGDIPCPRAAFSTAQLFNMCYMFGGRYKDTRKNDLYVLDSNSFTWIQLKPTGRCPIGRSWHILEAVSDHHLFLYGGIDNIGNALKDMWIYNIHQNAWNELVGSASKLGIYAPRMWHTACKTDLQGEVLIFGGCLNSVVSGDQTQHTNAVSLFRFSPLTLKRQCLDFIIKNINMYSAGILHLPLSLQRNLHHRSLALGLKSPIGYGKLISSCQMM